MYQVITNEPEGWLKAFQVTKDGQHVRWFRWRDDADSFVDEQLAEC